MTRACMFFSLLLLHPHMGEHFDGKCKIEEKEEYEKEKKNNNESAYHKQQVQMRIFCHNFLHMQHYGMAPNRFHSRTEYPYHPCVCCVYLGVRDIFVLIERPSDTIFDALNLSGMVFWMVTPHCHTYLLILCSSIRARNVWWMCHWMR